MNKLEARLVDDPGAENCGLGQTRGLLPVRRRIGARRKRELADPSILMAQPEVIILSAQRMLRVELRIEAQIETAVALRRDDGAAERRDIQRLVEDGRIDDGVIVSLAPPTVDIKSRSPGE